MTMILQIEIWISMLIELSNIHIPFLKCTQNWFCLFKSYSYNQLCDVIIMLITLWKSLCFTMIVDMYIYTKYIIVLGKYSIHIYYSSINNTLWYSILYHTWLSAELTIVPRNLTTSSLMLYVWLKRSKHIHCWSIENILALIKVWYCETYSTTVYTVKSQYCCY